MSTVASVKVYGPREVQALLWGLCLADIAQLRAGQVRVPLFRSGVVYRKEPTGREQWQTAKDVLRSGAGDCEDLVAWRVAELVCAGEEARPLVYRPRRGLLHCVVRRADGRIEDPSKKLGM